LNEEEAVQVCKDIYQNEQLFVEGIYSHIADPMSADYTAQQFGQFRQVLNRMEQKKALLFQLNTLPTVQYFLAIRICI